MMTREEAIALFEKQLTAAQVVLDSGFGSNPGENNFLYRRRKEMAEIALTALRPISREQVEKVWRGEWEWYDEEVGSPLEGIEREWGWRCSKCKVVLPDDFDDPDNPPAMRFCQWCGAPMTDEAVEMVMRRLEALKDGKDIYNQ